MAGWPVRYQHSQRVTDLHADANARRTTEAPEPSIKNAPSLDDCGNGAASNSLLAVQNLRGRTRRQILPSRPSQGHAVGARRVHRNVLGESSCIGPVVRPTVSAAEEEIRS